MALPVSSEKRVYDNVLGAMGHTPLVRLNRIGRDLPCPLYAKLELMNPGGQLKTVSEHSLSSRRKSVANLSRVGRSSRQRVETPAWDLQLRRH